MELERNAEGQGHRTQNHRATPNAVPGPSRPTAPILLRTNCTEKDPAKLWRWYMQLSEAEDAFRISKSDLSCGQCSIRKPSAWKRTFWSAF